MHDMCCFGPSIAGGGGWGAEGVCVCDNYIWPACARVRNGFSLERCFQKTSVEGFGLRTGYFWGEGFC